MIPLPVVRSIPLTQGLLAWVDQDDYEKVFGSKWSVTIARSGTRYAARSRIFKGEKRATLMHRVIMGCAGDVDHRNGNGLNNCRYNLREATKQQNGRGFNSRPSHFTSKYRGVSFVKTRGDWTVRITLVAGIAKNLGYFATEEEAARAYDIAALKRDPDFAHTNFPRETYGLARVPQHDRVSGGVEVVDRLQEVEETGEVQDGPRADKSVPVPC